MPKPTPKANLIHQQLLAGLLANRMVVHTEVRVKNVKKGKDGVYRHDLVKVDVPTPALAGNVSELNLNRAARRWAA